MIDASQAGTGGWSFCQLQCIVVLFLEVFIK